MVVHPSLRKTSEHITLANNMPYAPQSAKVNLNMPSSFDGSSDNRFYKTDSK